MGNEPSNSGGVYYNIGKYASFLVVLVVVELSVENAFAQNALLTERE